jgi:hypothetical protein
MLLQYKTEDMMVMMAKIWNFEFWYARLCSILLGINALIVT